MVNLLEYQGKLLFKRYGIKTPNGKLVKGVPKPKDVKLPVYVKVQVPTGHRYKLGGVVRVSKYSDLRKNILRMASSNFLGYKGKAFLLEKPEKTTRQFYLSISIDRSVRSPVLIVSKKGGVDIENVDKKYISSYTLNNFIGIPDYVKEDIAFRLGVTKLLKNDLYNLLDSVWNLYTKEDAELVEINPLGVTKRGLIALDSKISIDDDAMFRHKHICVPESSDLLEREAAKDNISFVRLSGNIGLIANGAGLTMATIDMIERLGGKAGDFLDLGGTDEPSKVEKAIALVSREHPSVLLINVFGGVTKADTVAEGIANAVKKIKPNFKIFVRLSGFNTERGKKILIKKGINAFESMSDAVRAAVEASL